MTRQAKTPQQRAQEALDVEERRVKKLAAKRAHLQGEMNQAVAELEAATLRRDYLKQHPDLKPTSTTPSTARAGANATGGNA